MPPRNTFSQEDLERLWDRIDGIASSVDKNNEGLNEVRISIAHSTGDFKEMKVKVNLLLWFFGALALAFTSWLFGLIPIGKGAP